MKYFPLQIDKLMPKGQWLFKLGMALFFRRKLATNSRIGPPKSPKGDFDYVLLDCDKFFHREVDDCFEVSQRPPLPYFLFLFSYYLFIRHEGTKSQSNTKIIFISEMKTSPFGGLRGLTNSRIVSPRRR